MAALPKRRISRGRKNRRRAQDFLDKPNISKCPKCGNPRRPHFQCESCGYYGPVPKLSTKAKES